MSEAFEDCISTFWWKSAQTNFYSEEQNYDLLKMERAFTLLYEVNSPKHLLLVVEKLW